MFIVLMWKPEAQTPTSIYTFNPTDPFDGIEVLGVVQTEADVFALIERAQKNMEPKPGEWKFLYEELPLPMEFPGGVRASK